MDSGAVVQVDVKDPRVVRLARVGILKIEGLELAPPRQFDEEPAPSRTGPTHKARPLRYCTCGRSYVEHARRETDKIEPDMRSEHCRGLRKNFPKLVRGKNG